MSLELLTAYDFRDGNPVSMEISGARLQRILPAASRPEVSRWLAPSLVDLQVNGFAGVDFQADDLTEEDLLRACRGLRDAGCGRFLLTVITDRWSKVLARLANLKRLRDAHPGLRRRIVGWHVEGPFLSERPGFHGAHDPLRMCDPSPERIEELRKALPGDPLLITVDPERSGALESIRAAVSMGIRVSLGHTDAPASVIAKAVEAGATGFTHLGNGCPQQLDRHDNILWRIFEQPGLSVGMIPDRVHVSDSLFRLAHSVLGPDAICYVSDSMSAGGAVPGRYPLAELWLEVGADQIVRRPGTAQFAGPALKPIDGVFRAASVLGEPWQRSWRRFSELPARWMGLEDSSSGADGEDRCLVTVGEDGSLLDLRVLGAADLG